MRSVPTAMDTGGAMNAVITELAELAASVAVRIVSSEVALAQVREARFVDAMTRELAVTVAAFACETCIAKDWRIGAALYVLLNRCVDASSVDKDDLPTRIALATGWMVVAIKALSHVPDPTSVPGCAQSFDSRVAVGRSGWHVVGGGGAASQLRVVAFRSFYGRP